MYKILFLKETFQELLNQLFLLTSVERKTWRIIFSKALKLKVEVTNNYSYPTYFAFSQSLPDANAQIKYSVEANVPQNPFDQKDKFIAMKTIIVTITLLTIVYTSTAQEAEIEIRRLWEY